MGLKSRINILSLILFISLFLFTPFSGLKRMVFLVPLFAVWLISAKFINDIALKKTLPLFAQLFLLMIIQWFYSSGLGDGLQFRKFFIQFFWTYVWGIFGVYYAYNINFFKKSIPFIVIMVAVSCVYTIVGNYILPGASRLLASTEAESSQMYTYIHSLNVGGYDFIFAIAFAVIPCTLFFKSVPTKHLLSIIFLFLLIITLFMGAYFTSIAFAGVGILISISNTRKFSSFLVFAVVFIILLSIFKDEILQKIIDIGVYIDSPALQRRAQQLLEGSYQDAYDEAGDYSRIDRMMNALHNIGLSPFWGRMMGSPSGILPSGHSEFLGYFERFGFFGSLYIYYFFSVFNKIQRKTMSEEMRLRVRLLLYMALAFIVLDTFDVANAAGCMIFFIAPCTMLYLDTLSYRMSKN